MAKIKQSPKLPPEKRRLQLLTAAEKLFVKKGYRGTTTDDIARKAGVTKGAFYHHFKSKEDILLAILDSMSCRIDEALASVPESGASPVDFLKALIASHKSRDLEDFRTLVDMWVQGIRIPRIRRYFDKKLEEATEQFADRVDRSYGRTRNERRQVAMFTWVYYDGLAARKSMSPNLVDLDPQLKIFSRLMEQWAGPKGRSNK